MTTIVTINPDGIGIFEDGQMRASIPVNTKNLNVQFLTPMSLPMANGHPVDGHAKVPTTGHQDFHKLTKVTRGRSPALDHAKFMESYFAFQKSGGTFKALRKSYPNYSENCLRRHISDYYEECRRNKIQPKKLKSSRNY